MQYLVISFKEGCMNDAYFFGSFYWHPKMAEDLIGTHSTSSHLLVSVSVGELRNLRVIHVYIYGRMRLWNVCFIV
jgi:hypothetical protein